MSETLHCKLSMLAAKTGRQKVDTVGRWVKRRGLAVRILLILCDRCTPRVAIAFALLNWQVVNAGNTPPHESLFIELPIFITVGTEPVAGIIMLFASKPDSHSVIPKSPKLLDKTVVQFFKPFTCQELYDRITTR
ncbi:hypothetical protein QUA40_27305 [Microcoleus sp. Pol11C3]